MIGKVVFHDQRNNLAKYYFDTISRFWPMTSFVTSFCAYSPMLSLNRLFKQLNLIFKTFLLGAKLFNMTRGTIWQKNYTMSCFWSMTSFVRSLCYISLNLPILFATEFLPSIIIGKVVERDQRNILVRYHFDTMFRFRPTTSFFKVSLLLLH